MKYCSEWGTKVEPGEKFCIECGNSLIPTNVTVKQEQPQIDFNIKPDDYLKKL